MEGTALNEKTDVILTLILAPDLRGALRLLHAGCCVFPTSKSLKLSFFPLLLCGLFHYLYILRYKIVQTGFGFLFNVFLGGKRQFKMFFFLSYDTWFTSQVVRTVVILYVPLRWNFPKLPRGITRTSIFSLALGSSFRGRKYTFWAFFLQDQWDVEHAGLLNLPLKQIIRFFYLQLWSIFSPEGICQISNFWDYPLDWVYSASYHSDGPMVNL